MRILQSGIFWLILLAAAVVIVVVIRKRSSSGWGFKDVVKNPRYWQQAAEAQEQMDAAVREAHGWTDEKVASMTKHYLFEVTSTSDAWAEARVLEGLGERPHRTVMALLRDPSSYPRLVKPTGEDILPEAPFNRACELLGDSPPSEAVEVLTPFLSNASKEIRKDAALAIAKTGADAIGPLIRKAFSDDDEYVRSYALMGLQFSLNRSGLSENVRKELFSDVQALLRKARNANDAAEILYRLDSEQARGFFLSEEVFTADSSILHHVLEVLANAKVSVPRPRLHGLIADLERKEMAYPSTYALGEALRLLGQHQVGEDRDILHARTSHSDEQVAQGASAGLFWFGWISAKNLGHREEFRV